MADNTTKMVAGVWSVTAIALFFLLSRIAFKWRSGKRIGADDWILATSWVTRPLPVFADDALTFGSVSLRYTQASFT